LLEYYNLFGINGAFCILYYNHAPTELALYKATHSCPATELAIKQQETAAIQPFWADVYERPVRWRNVLYPFAYLNAISIRKGCIEACETCSGYETGVLTDLQECHCCKHEKLAGVNFRIVLLAGLRKKFPKQQTRTM